MKAVLSPRAIGISLVLIAAAVTNLSRLAPAEPAAPSESFHAVATRDSVTAQGDIFTSMMHGTATHLGPFTGVSTIKCKGHHCFGPVVMVGNSSDSITFATDVTFDTHYQFGEGSYLITSGTGRFAHATGSGYFSVDERQGHDNAIITWEGTIDS